MDAFCAILRKVLRHIWTLPYNTHSVLLEHNANYPKINPFQQLNARQ